MELIDKKRLKEYLEAYKTCFTWNDGGRELALLKRISNHIDKMETTIVDRGEWINHRNDNGHNIADCNRCGNAIQWFDGDKTPKYCCMCGAKMKPILGG